MTQKTARTLGLFSVLCIGINAIIGSGVYKLPGRLGYYLGPASWLGFALCGLLLVTVALCFAEASGMFEASGGPYIYAREAFGEPVGFSIGWIAWVTCVTSWGAVANAIPGYLARFVPAAGTGMGPKVVVVMVILGLGIINYLGVKPGSITTNFFTVAKVLPLALFVILGIAHVSAANVTLVPSPVEVNGATGGSVTKALGLAMFAALFPLQGFEVAPVPAGETANPKRNVPIAVIGSLLGCAIFYVLIQLVAYGTRPEIATVGADPKQVWSTRPLADAAESFLGSGGSALLSLGACISMIGYCSGAALVTPRYLQALANDRLLPSPLAAIHPHFGSPHGAVVLTTGLTLVAGLTLDFDKLVDLSNVAVIFQYASTCAAVTWLRLKRPDHKRGYRVPGGAFLIPTIGIIVCMLLVVQAKWDEFAFSFGTIAIGGVIAFATRRLQRAPSAE
jgi:basic amino acid/polyamine antiporter, APA family